MGLEISEGKSKDISTIRETIENSISPSTTIAGISFGEVEFDFSHDIKAIEEGKARLRLAKFTEKNELAGFIIVYPTDGNIAKVYVNPVFRRMGIGAQLIADAGELVPKSTLLFADTIGGESIQNILLRAGFKPDEQGVPYRLTRKRE
jgi:GNAT superfamily N-acetyltransferase